MQKQTHSFELTIFNDIEELSLDDKSLLLRAVEARKKAYAPYSKFQVGAALVLENGVIVIGNNQENACYPSGLCAERVAIYHAGANYPGERIRTLAITATSENYAVDRPAAPCGNCRQSISEYEVKQGTPIRILMMGETGKVLQCESVADLLPLAFDDSFL